MLFWDMANVTARGAGSTTTLNTTGSYSAGTSSTTVNKTTSSKSTTAGESGAYPDTYATPPASTHYFGAPPTHFSQASTNYGAQSFQTTHLPAGVQNLLQSLPPEWLQRASAEQIQGLIEDYQEFHTNAYKTLLLNPSSVDDNNMLPTTTPIFGYGNYSDDIAARLTSDSDGGSYQPDPYSRRDQTLERHDSNWYDSINIPTLIGSAIPLARRGIQAVSEYGSVLESAESSELLGEAALDAVEGGIAEWGFEGLALGAAEAVGGAATIGAFLAGGEVIAGAALVGYGLYEGYKALGGTPLGQSLEAESSKVKSAFESFLGWGEGLFP